MNLETPENDDPKQVLRKTDDDARRLAKGLVRSARFGALAAIEPDTGAPVISRVAVATDLDGTPVILTSTLSGHTSAIMADPRCSLLVGEPGKGDPLAHSRISLVCRAVRLGRESDEHQRVRRRFLARHPKSALYADFGDFSFFRLELKGASLNGGFGKAFELHSEDLLVPLLNVDDWSDMDAGACAHMNEDHLDAIELYADVLCKSGPGNWKMACLDPEGVDLVIGDRIARLWFDHRIDQPAEVRKHLVALAKRAREN